MLHDLYVSTSFSLQYGCDLYRRSGGCSSCTRRRTNGLWVWCTKPPCSLGIFPWQLTLYAASSA
jgi:hypothetical protein